MTTRHLRHAALALLLAAGCAPAPAAPDASPAPAAPASARSAAGTYEFTGRTAGQPFQGTVRLARADDGGYSGTLSTSLTPPMPVRAVEAQGSRVRIVAQGRMGDAVLVLDLAGNDFTGQWTYGPSSGDLSGRLRPAA